jgi:putative flippase GtrA
MPWNPTNALPFGRRWLWVLLAVLVCMLQGPSFLRDLRPPTERGLDFFQDWASARNRIEGLPIYTRHDVTALRYMGIHIKTNDPFYVPVNAHPPASVLLFLPLAWLNYPDAFLAWELLSLAALGLSMWLVGRELGVRFSAWSVFPIVALLLICFPFRLHMEQGQLSIALLLLITLAWVAYRRGWPMWAGALLAAATSVKLFPGFLFLFFLLRRQWRVLVGGAIGFAVLTVVTATILGPDIYLTYLKEVLPQVGDYRSGWGNVSLPGIWFKLFDPLTERMRVEPLWRSPLLARIGALVCCAVVVAVMAGVTWRVRSQADEDRAFGIAVMAMLLVSPLTWEHYLPLLLIPLAVLWVHLPPTGATGRHWLFVVLLIALWSCTDQLSEPFLPGSYLKSVAWPVHTITLLSFKCYTLLGLFSFAVLTARRETFPGHGIAKEQQREGQPQPAAIQEPRPIECDAVQRRATISAIKPGLLRQQFEHARRWKRLFERKAGRLATPAQFALVGLSGMAIDLLSFALLGLWFPLGVARALAIWVAMTWNYALNRRVTFSGLRQVYGWRHYALFCGSCLGGALVSWSICVMACANSPWFAQYPTVAALMGVVAGFVLNYSLSRRFVFRGQAARTSPALEARPVPTIGVPSPAPLPTPAALAPTRA